MEKYYYEEIDLVEREDSGSPLKYHIFEKIEITFGNSKLMAWCYEEEFAKKLVNTLNEANNPVSAFANKIANLITEHDGNVHRHGSDLEAKLLYFSSKLIGQDRIAFDEYFGITTQKKR